MKENYRRCCGIDVHKNSVTVCVLPPVGQRHITPKKRKFRTYTRDLRQLRAWLKSCQVTEIAMESTGQYWRPLWNLLEGEFSRLILVNPQHIKGLNGYKTDPKDAQWIADLVESGKLRGSWVPPRPIRELRDLTRQRVNVLEDLNRAKKHLASWTGLCPGNRESGGKRMSGRTRKSNRYIKRALCQAAWAESHTKNTYLSAFYRRMSLRKGAPKAIIALAHHMILVVHQVLSRREEYVEFGGDYYDQRNKPRTVARLVKRLQKLGYDVDLRVVPSAEVAPLAGDADTGGGIVTLESSTEPPKRRRGRPCKCVERGITCRHQGAGSAKALIPQPSLPG